MRELGFSKKSFVNNVTGKGQVDIMREHIGFITESKSVGKNMCETKKGESGMKKMKRKLAACALALSIAVTGTCVGSFGEVPSVHAETGLNMNGTTIQGYAYSDSNFPVYNGTGAGRRQIGTCFGASDYIKILEVNSSGWSRITYPVGRGYKTGYCRSYYLFQNPNFPGEVGEVATNITTYRKADCRTKFGTSTRGDKVFVTGYACGNTQIFYPCPSFYKISWIKGRYVIQNGRLTGSTSVSNPQPNVGKVKLSYGLYKKDARITCGFDGYKNTRGRHEGIDISGGNNSPIYSLTDGEVVRVAYGYRGSKGLSTIAIYDKSANKTVIYLHSAPASLAAGQRITKGQCIGRQDWRGVSSANAGHTHVEVVNGRSGYAKKSVNDYRLENSNPTAYWNSKGYIIQ